MSTANPTAPINFWKSFYIPYLVLGVLHLPLILLYCFRDLWSDLRPHYHFFPFLFAAVVFLIWERWPRNTPRPLRYSWLSPILFALSVLILCLGLVFLEPPLASLSLALGLSSFLLRVKDLKSGGSLFPISLLLYVLVHSPFGQLNEDRWLITQLQRISSQITSVLLDLAGVLHDMPGTVLVTVDRKWGIEEACSGVQSFFTLLFCSVFWVLWMRRSWFQGSILVLSSVFWAIVMNTVRIFVIPIAFLQLGMDLSEGWQHAALGYLTLVVRIAFILSTDQFLDFTFGAIDSEKSGNDAETSQVSRFWNYYVAGAGLNTSTSWTPTSASNLFTWGFAGFGTLVALFLSPGLINLATTQGVDFFRSDVVLRVDKEWLPAEIDGWKLVEFSHSTRERSSDLGQRSDVWTYGRDGARVTFSFDQAFPGWHELTLCYQNSEIGWKIADGGLGRKRISKEVPPSNGPNDTKSDPQTGDPAAPASTVSLVSVQLEEATAGYQGHLYFGLDDAEGVSLEAPGDWSLFNAFLERLKNRMSYEIRASVFRGEAYQTQLFVQRQLSPEQNEAFTNLYLKLRSRVQQQVRLGKENKSYMSIEELESQRREEVADLAAAEAKQKAEAEAGIKDLKAGVPQL